MTQTAASVHPTIVEKLQYFSIDYPARSALRSAEGEWTFAELVPTVQQFAGSAEQSGIAPGQKVGVISTDPTEDLLVRLGLIWLGAVGVSLNPGLDGAARTAMAERIGLDHLLVGARAQVEGDSGILLTPEWVQRGISQPVMTPSVPEASDEIIISLSSGTTGAPTAFIYDSSALAFSVENLKQLGMIDDGSVYVAQTAHYLNTGTSFSMVMLMAGTTVVLGSQTTSLADYVDQVRREGATSLMLPVFAASALVAMKKADAGFDLGPQVRKILIGSDYCSQETINEIRDHLCPDVAMAYGSSLAGMVCSISSGEMGAKPGSAGRVLPGLTLQIVDVDDREVPVGQSGRIRIQTPASARRILGPHKLNGEEFRDGWCYTGDIGMLDADGYLYVLGREVDVICTAAGDVHPNQLQRRFAQVPGANEVVVAGVDRPEGDAIPVVFFTCADGQTPATVEGALRERVKDLMQPLAFMQVASIPRNPVGKVVKAGLRTAFLERSGA